MQMIDWGLWSIGTICECLLVLFAYRSKVVSVTAMTLIVLASEGAQWITLYANVEWFRVVRLATDVVCAIAIIVAAFDLAAKFAAHWKAIIHFAFGVTLIVFLPRIAYLLNQPLPEHRIRAFSSICMATSCAFLMALLMFKPSRYQAGENYKWLCWSIGFLAGGQVVMARIKEAFLFSVAVSRIRQGVWIAGIIALLFACAKFNGSEEKELRAWMIYEHD